MAYTNSLARLVGGRAALQGSKARENGQPVTACPYDPNSTRPVERHFARYWIKGWNRGRIAGFGRAV
jgi:ribosome modulation factor